MDNSSVIMAVIIDQRNNTAPQVQEVLTKYGCLISTRLGLHQVRDVVIMA